MAVSADGLNFAASWMDCQLEPGNKDVFWVLNGSDTSLLSRATKGAQGHTALICDQRGVFWAAWEDERSEEPEIWWRRSEKGFASRRLSNLQEDGPASFPALASGGGFVAAVYEAQNRSVILRILETQPSEKK